MTINAAAGGDRLALRVALELAAVTLVADLSPSEQLYFPLQTSWERHGGPLVMTGNYQ